jgi:hypothetical protein
MSIDFQDLSYFMSNKELLENSGFKVLMNGVSASLDINGKTFKFSSVDEFNTFAWGLEIGMRIDGDKWK